MDTSSIMSSETERGDTDDDEVLSFDLGPEPYDPTNQERLPSEGLDSQRIWCHHGHVLHHEL